MHDTSSISARISAQPLHERELHIRDLLDALPAAVYTTDAAGRITYYNQAAADLAGRQPVLGKDQWCVTWRLYSPDGVPMLHEQCPMAIALKENRPVRGAEAMAERPDGTLVPFIPYPTPLRDAAGTLVGAVNMLVDISGRKAAEEALRASEERYRRLNETLEARVAGRTRELAEANERLRAEAAERQRAEDVLAQLQKMEAVGQLASGIAHDFNNLLTAILGNLEMVEARLEDDSLRKMIQAASRAALRGAKLNEQMLAFSRKQHLAPRSVDLNALVLAWTDMMRRTLGGNLEVATSLAPNLWPALVDPTQIELIVLNLALNARDAMPLGGTVLIETRTLKASEVASELGLAPRDYVCLSVADSGTGMSEDVLAHACEPFFTTKEPGKGSGLGLSQVYGVARQSGGGIRITSAVGKGTVVEVYLPRSLERAEVVRLRDHEALGAADNRRTVLVVDDDPDVREVAVVHLKALGYEVAEAASGRAALDRVGKGGVDLLIADYAMPRMSGVELARAARAKRPGLPVVIVTGYLDVTGFAGEIEDAVILKKPYRVSELSAIVELALRRSERNPIATKVVALRS